MAQQRAPWWSKSVKRSKTIKPLNALDLAVFEKNTKRALHALETSGDAGLQKVLDQMFPGTKASSPSSPEPQQGSPETPPSPNASPSRTNSTA
jgi:hypothetical protein